MIPMTMVEMLMVIIFRNFKIRKACGEEHYNDGDEE